MDTTLEGGECEEEGAEGTMCDELVITPLTIPLYHLVGGGKEIRCEFRLILLVYAVLKFLYKSPAIDVECCFD